ncbi:hypothetical protein ACFOU2_10775 [Bacillus songklensis]|uniref:Uncharacterized protein n=1 Tax=Bacillus songklensis TaxID=1069116 RepID=A0ABV8B2N3_9BACI
MIEKLAEHLDMHYFFAPIYDFPAVEEGKPNRQYGVAILSKDPIVEEKNWPITRLSTQSSTPKPKLMPGLSKQ